MDLIFGFLVVAIALNLMLGGLIVFQNKKTLANVFFTLSIIFICLWSAGAGLVLFARTQQFVNVGSHLFYIGPVFTALFLVLFCIYFLSEQRARLNWGASILVAVASSVVLIVALNRGLLIKHILISDTGLNRIVINRRGWIIYLLYFSSYFGLSYSALLLKFRRAVGRDKEQLRYVFWAVFVTSVLASVTNLLLPWFGDTRLIWLGPIWTLIYVIITAGAILRYKLFDIRFFVIRAAAYSLTNTILAILYVAPIILIVTYLYGGRLKFVQQVLVVLVGTIAATNYNKIQSRFNAATSKIFFRDLYDPAKLISDLNKTLVTTIDLKTLLKNSSQIIERSIKSEYCVFMILDSESVEPRLVGHFSEPLAECSPLIGLLNTLPDQVMLTGGSYGKDIDTDGIMASLDIELVARISSTQTPKSDVLGYIILGPLKSGKSYDFQDVSTMNTITNTLVIAMQNALHFEEIQRFNETLHGRVDDATKKLRITNDKLRKLDETKDEFISMASHQLRTPLTSIKGYLSMVLEGDAGPINIQQRKMLNQSYENSQRMVFLISDLLNLSRLNTGKFVIDPSPVQLKDIVESEVGQLFETAKARDVSLVYDKSVNFPVVMLDETKMHQVVMNFMDNAVYYTRAGGTVTVSLKETPSAIECRVTDDGIGVPRSEQHRLFSKFYRANNAKAARPDGTGLGLFMAKKVIAASGGSIIFQSTEGKGSTFGFRFPKAAVTVDETKIGRKSLSK